MKITLCYSISLQLSWYWRLKLATWAEVKQATYCWIAYAIAGGIFKERNGEGAGYPATVDGADLGACV